MNTKQTSIEQRTRFEESLTVLDEAIAILQRIQKREEQGEEVEDTIY